MTDQTWQYTNGKKTKIGRPTWKRADGVTVHEDAFGTFVVMTAAGSIIKYGLPKHDQIRRFGTAAQARQYAEREM